MHACWVSGIVREVCPPWADRPVNKIDGVRLHAIELEHICCSLDCVDSVVCAAASAAMLIWSSGARG